MEEILDPSLLDKEPERTDKSSNIEGDLLLEKIVMSEGGESASSLKGKKEKGKAIISVVEKLKKDKNDLISPMTVEINSCSVRLKDLYDKKTALLVMLDGIENDIAAVNSRKKTLQSSITESEDMYVRSLSTVETNPINREAILATKMQEKIDHLVLKVISLENCFLSSLDEKADKNENKNKKVASNVPVKKVILQNEYPVRVSTSSTYLQEYVRTECQCLSLLAGRVVLLSSQLKNLKRELNAYKSLNMLALACDVETAIKKMETDIDEDKKALEHLQNDLCTSIQRYGKCLNITNKGKKTIIYYFLT